MAKAGKFYFSGMSGLLDGTIDWEGHTLKVLLASEAYIVDVDGHIYQDDITEEITAPGYTTGGVELENCAIVENSTAGEVRYNADDSVWVDIQGDFQYAIVYDNDGGSASTNRLIGYLDFDDIVEIDGTSLTLVWDTTGIFKFKV